MQPVIVYDSNVLISGIGWRGKPFKTLELARTGVVVGLTCPEILAEVAEKLENKIGLPAAQSVAAIADLAGFLQIVRVPGRLRVVAGDPDDDRVIERAVLGGATHIVTGDQRHLLPMRSFQGIAIVTPAELLEFVSRNQP